MTSIDKVNASVIGKVQAVCPGIPFTAQEKLEEITRPAFKLILDEVRSERCATGMIRRVYPVELVYFASDIQRPKLECLEIYEKIESTLLEYGALKASVDSQRAVLAIDFEVVQIDMTDDFEDDNEIGSGEDMENLDMEEF